MAELKGTKKGNLEENYASNSSLFAPFTGIKTPDIILKRLR
jgi:hypothetical protein